VGTRRFVVCSDKAVRTFVNRPGSQDTASISRRAFEIDHARRRLTGGPASAVRAVYFIRGTKSRSTTCRCRMIWPDGDFVGAAFET
jgi:hypothetical protein